MDPTEPPPGCLVLLLRLSAGMSADIATSRGEVPAFAAARQLADELLEGLVNTVAGGYAVGALDVAVLGYRAAEDGTPQLFSLLPDGDPRARFVPLAQVAEMPAVPRAGEGLPRKWAVLPACEGDPCSSAALASVYQMVAVWLTGRFASRAPVVIHCTGSDALDEAYIRSARSLGLLATAHGPARLMHYVFAGPTPSPEAEGELSLPSPLAGEGGESSRRVRGETLTRVEPSPSPVGEAPTPSPARGEGENNSSALPGRVFVNDWDIGDPWDAIFTIAPQAEEIAWAEAGAGFAPARSMWAQKMGNTPEQWEDAFALNEAGGAAAIADGASSGIYCSIWAQQLSQRFLSDRPDTRDPVPLNKWVNGLRTEWRTAINYSNLNWSKQAKVDQVGAAATLLGLELGPASANGNRPWRACAVGDASLFWVRAGKLLATFPVVAADQFGSAPLLVRSNPGFRTVALSAAGTCEPGDRFVLATDAVAARLFKSTAIGPGPEWGRFEVIAEDEWRAELDTLRLANDMVNDDCTLVVLRVSGAAPKTQESEIRGQRTEDREQKAEDAEQKTEDAEQKAEGAEQKTEQDQASSSSLTSGPCPLSSEWASDAGDLMIDLPHDPPAPAPEEEPPAARDGFPESTDPGV